MAVGFILIVIVGGIVLAAIVAAIVAIANDRD